MKRAGARISRMPPLRQPELQHVPQPKQRPVKARVALCADERRKSSPDDEREAEQTKQVKHQEEDSSG